MASIRKPTKSRFWYACITLPDGTQRQFTTGLTDPAEARAAATAAERAIRRGHEQPHKLASSLARIAADFAPAEDCHPADWTARWIDAGAATRATDTTRLYRDTLADLRAYLDTAGITTWTAFSQERAQAMREDLAARGLNPATVNAKVARLRAIWHAAIRAKTATENPWSQLAPLRTKATPRREFRPAELATLLSTVSGQWRALTLLGLHTGQRLNDLATLRWAALDMSAGTIAFHAAKTGSLVCLPIAAPALASLLADTPGSDDPDAPVFPDIAALPRQRRSDHFRAILESCGLALARQPRAKGQPARAARRSSPLSFHSLRHTFTTRLKAAGVSDSIARAIVGHSSAEVSRAYTHLDMDTMRRAIEQTNATT